MKHSIYHKVKNMMTYRAEPYDYIIEILYRLKRKHYYPKHTNHKQKVIPFIVSNSSGRSYRNSLRWYKNRVTVQRMLILNK